MTPEPQLEPPLETVDLRASSRSLLRYWPAVLIPAALTAAIGVALMLRAKPVWQASTTLLFANRPASLLSIGSAVSSLSAAAALGGPQPVKVHEKILESQAVLDDVAKRSGEPGERIKGLRKFESDQTTSTLTIYYRDEDPRLAARITRLHVAALRRLNATLQITPLTGEESLLNRQLRSSQAALKAAENKLLAFQRRAQTAPNVLTAGAGDSTAVFVLPGPYQQQLSALRVQEASLASQKDAYRNRLQAAGRNALDVPTDIPALSTWRQALVRQEYEYRNLVYSQGLGPENPAVVRARRAIEVTRQQVRTEIGKYLAGLDRGLAGDVTLATILGNEVATKAQIEVLSRLAQLAPGEATTYQRLVREVGTQTAIVNTLRRQASVASLQTEADPNRWSVLDDGVVGDKPINKGLIGTVAKWGAGGFLIGVLLAGVLRLREIARERV